MIEKKKDILKKKKPISENNFECLIIFNDEKQKYKVLQNSYINKIND
jgi:hypothetical protein